MLYARQAHSCLLCDSWKNSLTPRNLSKQITHAPTSMETQPPFPTPSCQVLLEMLVHHVGEVYR